MANIEKMQEEYDALMKKYESASLVREWNNAARNVNLTENMNFRKKQIAGMKKRFQEAVDEEVEPEV